MFRTIHANLRMHQSGLAVLIFLFGCGGSAPPPSTRTHALDSLIASAERLERIDPSASHQLALAAMHLADSLDDPYRRALSASGALYTAIQLDSSGYFDRMEPEVLDRYARLNNPAALARHLRRIGESHYRKSLPVPAEAYFREALPLARSSGAGVELATCLSSYGSLLVETDRPGEAVEMQRAALRVLDSIGVDSMPLTKALGNMGYAMGWTGQPDSAIWYHHAAIASIDTGDRGAALPWNLMNLGAAYIDKGMYGAALGSLQRAYDVQAELGMAFDMAASIYYMAYCHQHVSPVKEVIAAYDRVIAINDSLGMPQRKMAGHANLGRFLIDLDSTRCQEGGMTITQRDSIAMAHCRSALLTARQGGYANNLSDILDALSDTERKTGLLDSAIAHAREAIRIRERMENPGRTAGSYKDLGMALHVAGRHAEAEQALRTGLDLLKTSPNPQNEIALHDAAQALQADMGRYQAAYEHLQHSVRLNETVLSESKRQDLVQQKLQWDFDKERLADSLAAAERLNKAQDQRIIAELQASRSSALARMIGATGLLLLSGAFVIHRLDRRRRRERFAKQAAQLETKALRAQMDPHFIGNTLHAVNSYLLSNDPANASTMLARFAKWIRNTLESSRHEEVTLRDDIEAMRTYLALEQARTKDKFSFAIEVPADEALLYTGIPPMLVQPFLENAIQHGVLPKDGPGHIVLRVQDKNDHLLITVEDDGVGRPSAKGPDAASTRSSLSTTITRERLQLLAERTGRPAGVSVVDLEQGTRVELEVPTA